MAQPYIVKSRFGQVITVVVAAISVAGIVSSVVAIGQPDLWRAIVPLALLGWGAWLAYWRPSVVCGDDSVDFRNLLSYVHIPYGAVDDVSTRYTLTVTSGERSYGAWAAPAPSGLDAVRLSRQSHGREVTDRHGTEAVRPGDVVSTGSGGAAAVIKERVARTGRDDGARVTLTWNRPLIAVTAALVAGSLASLLLGH